MADESNPVPGEGSDEAAPRALAEASFLMLVASLSAQAAHHLGIGPEGDVAEADLRMAKFTIDLLGILGEKTEGNLTDEEKGYLDNQLFNLRMRFVEASKGGG